MSILTKRSEEESRAETVDPPEKWRRGCGELVDDRGAEQLQPASPARTAYMIARVVVLSIFAVTAVIVYALAHFVVRGVLFGVAAATVLASALLTYLIAACRHLRVRAHRPRSG